MMYQFMTLNDNTEIVHSESLEKDGREQVEVRKTSLWRFPFCFLLVARLQVGEYRRFLR